MPAVEETQQSSPPVVEREKGEAPIKKEYLVVYPTERATAPAVKPNAEGSSEPQPKRREKASGQNKNRKQKNKQVYSDASRLCAQIALGEECKFGEKCTFSHDVDDFLAHRDPELGNRCVLFDLFGKCRFGLRCRFSSAHTTDDYKQIVDEEKAKLKTVYCTNDLGRDMQIRLRKRQVKFPRTEEITKILENEAKEGEQPIAEIDKGGEDAETDRSKRHKGTRGHIDYRGKTYLAPLTTVGNLPFRRICKGFGVDITCSEMAIATNLLQGQHTEWALLKRHPCEDLFGIQLAGNRSDILGRAAEIVSRECETDFIDLNMGCPIDMAYNNGGGSALMGHPKKISRIVRTMHYVTDCDVTVKFRTGINKNDNVAHTLIPQFEEWGAALGTLHGRSRQQRYTKLADWEYIAQCKKTTNRMPLFGGGDVMSWEEYWEHMDKQCADGIMIGRGALIKPWIFKEINERKVWDISATERLDILKDFAKFGMEHWGTDTVGINNVRRYLLEWQSFLHRYIPVSLLEVLPQRMNERPPPFVGRNDLETLMASDKVSDWIKISEMLLGPAPDNYTFLPKHKSNSYEG